MHLCSIEIMILIEAASIFGRVHIQIDPPYLRIDPFSYG